MIKAKELRIGNLVLDCNEQYSAVDGLTIMQLEIKEKEYPDSTCPLPIPLNREIFEKCGLTLKENIIHWANVDDDCSYYFILLPSGKELQVFLDFSSNFTESAGLKHLHQLQNLYFALTGEELEINL